MECSSIKELKNDKFDFLRPLTGDIYIAFPLEERLDSFEVGIKNNSKASQKLEYEVLVGSRKENYLAEKSTAKKSIVIESYHDGYVKIDVNAEKGLDDKIYVMFRKNENLSIFMTNNQLTGVLSFSVWEKEEDKRDCRRYVPTRLRENICFKNVLPKQNLFSPENVLSGYNRPYGLPRLWISEGLDNQYLKISFDNKEVKEIHLVFDTDLSEDIIEKQSTMTIKDYVLVVKGNDFLKEFEIKGNYRRINRFEINHKINCVEFYPKGNYGSSDYNLFGVKIY